MSKVAKMMGEIVGQVQPGTRTAVVVDDPDVEFEILDINDTGIEPVEYRCVVRLDTLKDDDGDQKSAGGIIIPQERTDRDQMAYTKATLLGHGGNAFSDWKGRIPQVGDRVMVAKYAGITREADPTDLIRLVTDKEILAVLT